MLIIFNNAPIYEGEDNTGSSILVNKGEELGNIGLSFTSKEGERVSVDTMITLDGVRVNSVDTSLPGVYSITQVARDKLGRTTKVVREVVVLDNEEIKEEIVQEEVIKEVINEIVLPVEIKVETTEKVNEVKVIEVETNKVEMKLDSKVKVNGYKKKKEIRRVRKDKFSFKLFSKYFFKVYDG